MASYFLPFEVRRYLIAEGAVQMPGAVGSLASCYVSNPDGPPQATDAEPVIVHLTQTPGFSKSVLENYVEFPTIDITIRALPDSANSMKAWETARAVASALDGKRAIQMGNINVGLCSTWREFGQLYDGEGHLGIRLIGAYAFEVRKSQLTQ